MEACPSIGILTHRCRFILNRNAFLLLSFRTIQALMASQLTFDKYNDKFSILFSHFLITFLLFVSHFTQLTCDILGIGLLYM